MLSGRTFALAVNEETLPLVGSAPVGTRKPIEILGHDLPDLSPPGDNRPRKVALASFATSMPVIKGDFRQPSKLRCPSA
ncbi:hypothetical protein ATY81_09625 [Rhizobium sp. R72]|nr:hypothetical protein ATY81_09625 [Rhizobium sp. R72]OWV95728.1 hypothetical protein ATY80_09625 [Rhizobium sp. R711]